MNQAQLTDFATRYAAAWSSQNPARLASLYTENGSRQLMPVLRLSGARRSPRPPRDS